MRFQNAVSKCIDLPRRFSIAVVLVASISLQSCSRSQHDSVKVFVASSVVGPLQEIKAAFESSHPEIRIELISAGSQVLAMQISEGAPADIFISADIRQMDRVNGFSEPAVLVENNLVAIVGLNSAWSTLDEAIDQASGIVIAQDAVPAGQYAFQALNEMGLWERAESKIVSYEHSVSGVLAKVVMGQADLGFVYRTDALNETDAVQEIEFPGSVSVRTQTWISQNAESFGTHSPDSTVYRYILESLESNRIFVHYGFQRVGPES
ncbi:MAG: molybdate ABC transporter substrate-binding protein [Phycisphaerales bacterium]|nr:molybdate ABC transporter substrate-binding protein [Phycisphaerales bacterium]